MRTVYTTEKIKIENVRVLGIESLPKRTRKWIRENATRLITTCTLPERITAEMLSRLPDKPVRQAFFMIRKRCYFLDFFFPNRMVALEIDGSVHKKQKEHDKKRDADFRSIGIRTIRIKNAEVMNGRLYEKLFQKMYKKR